MEVNFHLPGLRQNYPLNMLVLSMLKLKPDWFREGVRVASFFGEFPTSLWNGGRPSNYDQCDASFVQNVVKNINAQGVPVRSCFEKSFCLSADVTAAYDPDYADVYEKRNAAYLNYGVGLCKYTGARGKSGASDADAETVAYVRRIFDGAGVAWQIAELGKVDAGGGGTVAMYMANRNISTLDAGVPVLSMHAPFETVSKLDCYETYKGMRAVFQAKDRV